MATGTYAGPVRLPTPSRRTGSATIADVYPGFGGSTAAAGGEGATLEASAATAGAPPLQLDVRGDFLSRPAGWLVLGIAAIAALSWFDR